MAERSGDKLDAEAADEIERLEKRIEELLDANGYITLALAKAQDEIGRLRQDVSVVSADICAENDNLQTEVLRLRAALHTIAGTPKFAHPPVEEMIDIAKVALNEEGRDIAMSILQRDRL
jgi:HAMP domain-containing protein